MIQNRQHDSNQAESKDRAPERFDGQFRPYGSRTTAGSVPSDSHQQDTSIPHKYHFFFASCVCPRVSATRVRWMWVCTGSHVMGEVATFRKHTSKKGCRGWRYLEYLCSVLSGLSPGAGVRRVLHWAASQLYSCAVWPSTLHCTMLKIVVST